MARFPIPSFNFEVSIEGTKVECSEVSGLKGTMEFHEVRSGTHNNLNFRIPTKVTYGDITFKKGVIKGDPRQLISELSSNFDINANYAFKSQWQNITIDLRNEANVPIYQWTLINPSLVSWEFSPFNAMSNELTFETLVFNCIEIRMDPL